MEELKDEINELYKIVSHCNELNRKNELLGIIVLNLFEILDNCISEDEFQTKYPDEFLKIKKAYNQLKEINKNGFISTTQGNDGSPQQD